MRVFIGYLEQIVGKSLFVCFIYMFIFICCISCHFWRFMLLNAALWLAVTLTFKGSEPKLAHWPKWNCITLPSWFCSLLTSNRGVSISHFLDSFTNFAWNTKNLVKSSLCEYIETNIPVARLTLHVFVWYFHQIVGKICLNASFICLSRFIAFWVTFNGLWCWTQRCGLLSRIHLKVIDESWHTGPNEFVLQLEVVFVVCWLETGKLVLVALCAVSLILLKLHKTFS